MPFSCCFFLPEVAPGLTVPSLDAPGAGWFWADAMSVEPNSDVTTRAEIASLDRIRNVSMRFAGLLQTSAGDLVPVRDIHCANFIFQKTRLWPPRNIRHLPNIGHLPNTGFAQSSFIDFARLDASQTSSNI